MAGREGAIARDSGAADRHPLSLNDPELVRREYESEAGLTARSAVFRGLWGGKDAREEAFAAVAEAQPADVLEVGCGEGAFAERVAREFSAQVTAVDLSPRMVELARARGVAASVADVQDLPFADASFDCAVANWMLYHVPDLNRALAELARVLRCGGRLIATTTGSNHFAEIWRLFGEEATIDLPFSSENGARLLAGHFATVERRRVRSPVRFEDREALRAYIAATITRKRFAERLPQNVPTPFVAHTDVSVFVAEK